MTDVILLTAEYAPFPGGIGTYASELAREAREAGARVTVFAPDYPDLPQADEPGVRRVWRHHRIGPGGAVRAIGGIARAPRDAVVLACDIRTVLVAFLAKVLTGRAYRVGVHGSEVSKFGRASGLKRLFRAAYLGADMISANSRATLDLVETAFGSSGRGVVNHLGVDRRWFAPADGGFEHPALAGLPEAAALVATVGRIEERKGQREAVRVVAAARRLRPELDLVYVVAGRPENEAYAAEVAALADRLAVPIVFTGRATEADLARLYRRSGCHLLCAQPEKDRIEGFGLVLLEAAAQGCPSVTTRVGGIPEVVAPDGGAVREPDDLEGLAEAVAAYAGDPGRRAAAGAAARRHAEAFSWRRCAQGSFPELYRGAKKD